jgi:hypothetical protein
MTATHAILPATAEPCVLPDEFSKVLWGLTVAYVTVRWQLDVSQVRAEFSV